MGSTGAMKSYAPQLLLIDAVAAVGVPHTIVPDHWVPIAFIAFVGLIFWIFPIL